MVVPFDPVEVWFQVPEHVLPDVRPKGGRRVTEVAAPGCDEFPHAAIVYAVNPTIDPATRTARCRVTVANPKETLRPGQSVRVRVRPPAE